MAYIQYCAGVFCLLMKVTKVQHNMPQKSEHNKLIF